MPDFRCKWILTIMTFGLCCPMSIYDSYTVSGKEKIKIKRFPAANCITLSTSKELIITLQ